MVSSSSFPFMMTFSVAICAGSGWVGGVWLPDPHTKRMKCALFILWLVRARLLVLFFALGSNKFSLFVRVLLEFWWHKTHRWNLWYFKNFTQAKICVIVIKDWEWWVSSFFLARRIIYIHCILHIVNANWVTIIDRCKWLYILIFYFTLVWISFECQQIQKQLVKF